MTDKELIQVIYNDIKDIKKALFGNGKEGLTDRVTRLEVDQSNMKVAIRAGKADIKWLVMAAIAIFSMVKDKLFKWL